MEYQSGSRWRGFARVAGTGRSVRAAALLTAAIGLAGCQDKHEWHQKLTVVVDTPSGKVSGSSVVEVKATFGQVPLSEKEVWYSVRGEASVVEVAPGRFLFALLGGSSERYYRAERDQLNHMDRGDWLKRIPNIEGVVTLERKNYPLLVSFRNIDEPKSVRKVNPSNLDAIFGPGLKLDKITLEIVEEPVSEGTVESVLQWFSEVGDWMLDGQQLNTDSPSKNLANNLTRLDFKRD